MAQIDTNANQTTLEARCAIVRYSHVNRVALGLMKLGTWIKVCGVLLSITVPIFTMSVPIVGLATWLMSAVIGSLSGFILGSFISAVGFVVRTTNDMAVNTSPFLNDAERAEAIQLHNHAGSLTA